MNTIKTFWKSLFKPTMNAIDLFGILLLGYVIVKFGFLVSMVYVGMVVALSVFFEDKYWRKK